jgi:MFS family permease
VQLKVLFQFTSYQQGFITASAFIGAVIGSLAAAKPGDLFGRRYCLIGATPVDTTAGVIIKSQ